TTSACGGSDAFAVSNGQWHTERGRYSDDTAVIHPARKKARPMVVPPATLAAVPMREIPPLVPRGTWREISGDLRDLSDRPGGMWSGAADPHDLGCQSRMPRCLHNRSHSACNPESIEARHSSGRDCAYPRNIANSEEASGIL